MRLQRAALLLVLPVLATATPLGAQQPASQGARPDAPQALRAAPSGRATTEVTLVVPRPPAPAGAQAAAQPQNAQNAQPAAAPLTIRIDYGQPHLRGRTLHTDSLVPYDRPWRTGANASTTLTTGVDLVIGGQPVPKGTYVLWTMPRRTGWTLMVQKRPAPATMQQEMTYDPANDVARVELRAQTLATPVESLTITLVPSTAPGAARGELRLAWGTTALSTEWMVR